MYTHYPKLYIRTQKNVPFSLEDFPLAFATPYEDNEAGKKRQATVDTWAKGGYYAKNTEPEPEATIIDNIPISGFRFHDFDTRYSTDNKVFEILDPRGFKLQISAKNLTDIIQKNTLINGLIDAPLIWARTNDNYLVSADESLTVVEKRSSGLEVGDVVSINNTPLTFFGQFFYTIMSHRYNTVYKPGWVHDYTKYEINLVNHPKKIWLFMNSSGRYVVYKGNPKFHYVTNQPLGFDPLVDFLVNTNDGGGYFFKTKEDQAAFDDSFDRVKADVLRTDKSMVENDYYKVLYQNREILID